MSGCFGNSYEDRLRERELNRYLDSTDPEREEEEIDAETDRKIADYEDSLGDTFE